MKIPAGALSLPNDLSFFSNTTESFFLPNACNGLLDCSGIVLVFITYRYNFLDKNQLGSPTLK